MLLLASIRWGLGCPTKPSFFQFRWILKIPLFFINQKMVPRESNKIYLFQFLIKHQRTIRFHFLIFWINTINTIYFINLNNFIEWKIKINCKINIKILTHIKISIHMIQTGNKLKIMAKHQNQDVNQRKWNKKITKMQFVHVATTS